MAKKSAWVVQKLILMVHCAADHTVGAAANNVDAAAYTAVQQLILHPHICTKETNSGLSDPNSLSLSLINIYYEIMFKSKLFVNFPDFLVLLHWKRQFFTNMHN